MFGHRWEPAEATIIAAKPMSNWSHGAGDSAIPYEYVVDVQPPDQPVFRATFHEPLMHGHFDHPQAGQVVSVLYDPKSHKVKLDPESKLSPHQRQQEQDASFRAIADAPSGTPAAGAEADPPSTQRIIPPPS